jgi:ketosteroid isomerase-like protein
MAARFFMATLTPSTRMAYGTPPTIRPAGRRKPPGRTDVSQPPNDFDAFLQRRKAASDAFVNGDPDPLAGISAQQSPATLFGPKGDSIEGADKVNAANAGVAGRFKPGSRNTFDVLHKAADGELAYWVGIQRSVVQMDGHDEGVPMDLRVTEIFRREGGQWKLFHRHADRLEAGSPSH